MNNYLMLIVLVLTIFVAILTLILVYKEMRNDEILKDNKRLKLELLEMSAYAKSLKRLNDIQEHLLKKKNI